MPPAKRTLSRRRSVATYGLSVVASPKPAAAVALVSLGAFIASCGLFGAFAGHASAGPVRGHVTGLEKLVPEVYAEAAKPEAHRYTWREPSPTVRAEFRALTANPTRDVCIAALGAGGGATPTPMVVKIAGGHTSLTNVVVAPGTHITFENRDPFPHRLYAVNLAGWKAETIAPSSKREWTAPAGQNKFEFRDELAPSLRLYVMVDPQVVDTAYPGRDGNFSLNLQPGEYTLQAFFNGKRVGKPISVTAQDKRLVELKDSLFVAEGDSK